MTGDGIVRESRPVRKVMSRAKRAEITENFEQAAGGEDNVRFDFDAVVDNKVRAHSELCTGVFFSVSSAALRGVGSVAEPPRP